MAWRCLPYEIDPADGYSIINASETVYLADSGVQSVVTVSFDNAPDGILLIRKVCSVNPSITLQDAEFKVTYADGTLIGDSNGIYRTDAHGEIRIEGLKPGKSVIVTETKAPAGFIIDTQSQTVQIKEGRTVSLTFKNQPRGKLIIQKRDSQTNQVLPGAEFRVTTAAGCEVGLDGVIGTATLTQNGLFTTDSNGEIRISNLALGAYVLTETKAPAGYVMDSPSTNVVIGPNGDTQTVIITNTPKATLTITKRDAVTRKPLANAEFIVRDSEGHAVGPTNGIYKTGTDGTVVVSGLEPGSTIMVSESKAPTGYILDETPKSIVVKSGISNSLIFDNEPGTTLIIRKFVEGTENEPLSGVCFKVVDGSGAAVGPDDGCYYTDKAGEIVLEGIEPGREAQRNILQRTKQTAKTAAGLSRKAAIATAKVVKALIGALSALMGGVVLVAALCVIFLVAAVIVSPFGILFANEPSPGAVPLNAAVSQINMELTDKLTLLQSGTYDRIDIQGAGPDWREVTAVFACKTAMGTDSLDVAALTPDRVERLKTVFWDMCTITSRPETIDHPAVGSTAAWSENVLHITVTAKTADDMRTTYLFSGEQNSTLTELLAELGVIGDLLGDLSISQGNVAELLRHLPEDLSPERRAVVETACKLVGKVTYFWGGKSRVIGWDSRWGTLQKVWASGNSTSSFMEGIVAPLVIDRIYDPLFPNSKLRRCSDTFFCPRSSVIRSRRYCSYCRTSSMRYTSPAVHYCTLNQQRVSAVEISILNLTST